MPSHPINVNTISNQFGVKGKPSEDFTKPQFPPINTKPPENFTKPFIPPNTRPPELLGPPISVVPNLTPPHTMPPGQVEDMGHLHSSMHNTGNPLPILPNQFYNQQNPNDQFGNLELQQGERINTPYQSPPQLPGGKNSQGGGKNSSGVNFQNLGQYNQGAPSFGSYAAPQFQPQQSYNPYGYGGYGSGSPYAGGGNFGGSGIGFGGGGGGYRPPPYNPFQWLNRFGL